MAINNFIGRMLGYKLQKAPYSRPSTLLVKHLFQQKPIDVIEVGCAAANNALDILSKLNVAKFIAVDPYENCLSEYNDYSFKRLVWMKRKAKKR